MKIVLDTNVLVSGLLSHQEAAAQVMGMAAAGAVTLCFDARVFQEYRGVLARPRFAFPQPAVSALLDELRAGGELVTTEPLPIALPDPADEPFLQAAIAGHAEFLVTFNLKHYPAAARAGVQVGPPAEFLRHYRERDSGR